MATSPWRSRAAVVVLVLLSAASQGASAQQRTGPAKPRVGISDIVTYQTSHSVEDFWNGSNFVAEVVALETGPAFERDPNTPKPSKMPWTPTLVDVREIYRNTSGLPVAVGARVRVIEPYGRVEGPDYYVQLDSGPRDFMVGERHVVFLTCNTDLETCMPGLSIATRGDSLRSERAPGAVVALGIARLRERLRALKAADEKRR
jgi:hypothetical protein